jgi:hypothetical protein
LILAAYSLDQASAGRISNHRIEEPGPDQQSDAPGATVIALEACNAPRLKIDHWPVRFTSDSRRDGAGDEWHV